ncbi:hypothetical protein VUR80DRAFT_9747 [Thermomyces stellatus]
MSVRSPALKQCQKVPSIYCYWPIVSVSWRVKAIRSPYFRAIERNECGLWSPGNHGSCIVIMANDRLPCFDGAFRPKHGVDSGSPLPHEPTLLPRSERGGRWLDTNVQDCLRVSSNTHKKRAEDCDITGSTQQARQWERFANLENPVLLTQGGAQQARVVSLRFCRNGPNRPQSQQGSNFPSPLQLPIGEPLEWNRKWHLPRTANPCPGNVPN